MQHRRGADSRDTRNFVLCLLKLKDDCLRKTMDTFRTFEKNGGRLEERTGFVTHDIDWFYVKDEEKTSAALIILLC